MYGIMRSGSVAEWLKAHDSKSCGQKCLGGSNPLASAISQTKSKLLLRNGNEAIIKDAL